MRSPEDSTSLDFLLALVVSLGAAWLGLLGQIVELTTRAPADRSLFVLGTVHYGAFVYFVLAVVVLYRRSMRGLSPSPPPVPDLVEKVLLRTWPFLLAAMAVSWVFVKIADDGYRMVVPLFGTVGVVASSVAIWRRGLGTVLKYLEKHWSVIRRALVSWFAIGIALPLYFVVMSWCFASAVITVDKEFYVPGETLTLELRASGYVFLPYIESVWVADGEYAAPKSHSANRVVLTHRIAANAAHRWSSDDMVYVTLRPQVGFGIKHEYEALRVAR
jgi:hypothetical protein